MRDKNLKRGKTEKQGLLSITPQNPIGQARFCGRVTVHAVLSDRKSPVIWALKALAAHCDISHSYPHYLRVVRQERLHQLDDGVSAQDYGSIR